MKKSKVLIVLSFIFLIQSCGINFWYNRMDWVVTWYIDDFVDLTDRQEKQIEQFIERETEWHRKEELPKYIALIDNIKQDIKNKTVEDNYNRRLAKMSEFYHNIFNQLSDDVIQVIASFSDDQILEIYEQLESEEKKALKTYQKRLPEKRLQETEDYLNEDMQEWIGRLDKKQKMITKEWATTIIPTYELTIKYRQRWRLTMLTALKNRNTSEGQKVILDYMSNPEQFKSDELLEKEAKNELTAQKYTFKIYDSLSEKQTKQLIEKLDDYKDSFNELLDD